jgi:uncharacterized membrane protein
MRALIRGIFLAAALVAGPALIAACQRQGADQVEGGGEGATADREAEMAAEQLAALGGPASPEQRALYEGEFQASGGIAELEPAEGGGDGGGEGAWELRLLEDYAQFSRPGLGDDGGITGQRDYRERGMRVVAGVVTITIRQEPCVSSGIELPYVAQVIFEGVTYSGCARRGIDEGERPTWASVVTELMPAIDACLGRVRSQPARVTFAAALDDERVSVRLREANGSRFECIADTLGTEAGIYEPLSDLDRRSGEGDPEFVRGASEPRAQNCRDAAAVTAGDGETVGWLIRRSC